MKFAKRLLCGVLVAVLLLPAALAAPSEVYFPDTQGHWAQEEINEAFVRGWLNGYPDETFRPDATITRAEFVKMLLSAIKVKPDSAIANWLASKNKTNQGPLNDMTTHWLTQQGWTDAALASGIVVANDYDKHNFVPEKPIARYEIALMADRALGLVYPATHEENIDLSFTDKNDIQDWMLGYVKEATDVGILKGYPDGSFGPKKTATRAEAVVMISRVLNEMEKGFDSHSDLSLVCGYYSPFEPVASTAVRVVDRLKYLDIDGTIYIPARVLLQTWTLLSMNYDFWGYYSDNVQWDPISQCLSLTDGYANSMFYPGCQGYNFNVGEIFDPSHNLLAHFDTPPRMLYGDIMIPISLDTNKRGLSGTLTNHTLTMCLGSPVDPPTS